jgi:hypothetical protein
MDRYGQASELSVGKDGEKVEISGLLRTPKNRSLAERESVVRHAQGFSPFLKVISY